ncbi:MAG: AbgT family transporter [Myxococcales bacterium]|nr:AbgT family transporter [Myxococcales bacterium]
MADSPTGARRGLLATFLDVVERVGNRLPDPITLFGGGAVFVLLLSWVGATLEWQVDKPVAMPVTQQVLDSGTGQPVEVLQTTVAGRRTVLVTDSDGNPTKTTVASPILDEQGRLQLERGTQPVKAVNLLSRDGFKWVLDTLVSNFTGFHPLGVVLVAMLGIGIAEKTGLVGAILKAITRITPQSLLTPAMVFVGILSSLAADAGYVVLPPIAAALYKAAGRSPLAGMAAVFAGVSAGFSANLVITSLDPLLSGLSEAGAAILDPSYTVNPAANWWFMIASTGVLTLVGWVVTARFVEPRYDGKPADEGGPSPVTEEERAAQVVTDEERAGLRMSLGVGLFTTALCLALIFVPGGPLYAESGEAPRWGQAIVPMIFFIFLSVGVAFGIPTGKVRAASPSGRLDGGIARLMAETMADMGPYIVLAFFAAQFVAWFNHSQLGIMLAILGGDFLASLQMPPQVLMAAFIVVAMMGNLFIGSASAKYAFFAPVFVPMFMAVGISPELTQAAYRIGDSSTNIITPLNPYFVVILVFMQKYVPKAGIGTLVSMMLPYSIAFWLIWTLMLMGWMTLGWPLGPEGPLTYDAGI